MNPQNDFESAPAKSWEKSTGVVGGGLGTILAAALLYQQTGNVPAEQSVQLVGLFISVCVALWGRITAKRRIKF